MLPERQIEGFHRQFWVAGGRQTRNLLLIIWESARVSLTREFRWQGQMRREIGARGLSGRFLAKQFQFYSERNVQSCAEKCPRIRFALLSSFILQHPTWHYPSRHPRPLDTLNRRADRSHNCYCNRVAHVRGNSLDCRRCSFADLPVMISLLPGDSSEALVWFEYSWLHKLINQLDCRL